MHPIIAKTFGGLEKSYYFRHFLFGLIFPAMMLYSFSKIPHPIPINLGVLLAINTLLYPYARFVYESITSYIMGDNLVFINAFFMLFMKLITMSICWSFAIFIAPIGLGYLYYYHSKSTN